MRWLLACALVSLLLAASVGAARAQLPDPCLLLTSAQVATTVGGAPTHVESPSGTNRSCKWTGPPQGYMQTREQFMVFVTHVTRAQFGMHAYRDIPKSDPVPGLGALAFASGTGLEIWENGFEVDLDGSYVSVYPAAAKRLARSALKRLPVWS